MLSFPPLLDFPLLVTRHEGAHAGHGGAHAGSGKGRPSGGKAAGGTAPAPAAPKPGAAGEAPAKPANAGAVKPSGTAAPTAPVQPTKPASPATEPKPAAAPKGPTVMVDPAATPLYENVPESLRAAASAAGLKEVRVVSSVEMAKIAGRPKPGYDAIEGTYKEDGRLFVLKKGSAADMQATLNHELAHAIDKADPAGKFTISESKEWLAAGGWKADKKGNYKLKEDIMNRSVSSYGRTSPWEDFAESFRVMTTGSKFERRVMQGESEKRYAFMQKFLAEKGHKVE